MGGCGGGRGRGVCISGIGSCHVGGRSIYSIYSCDVCGWWGVVCSVVNMFSIYIMYSGYRLWRIAIYSIYRRMTSASYSWVFNVGGLGGVCQLGCGVGRWCPRGRLRSVGDMRHSSS